MTLRDMNARIERGIKEGEFIINKNGKVVCAVCHGNCGQCGYTDALGCDTPADMQALIDNLAPKPAKHKGPWWNSWWFLALMVPAGVLIGRFIGTYFN